VFGVGNSPEPLPQDFLTERLDLTEGDRPESCPSSGKGESSNPGK